MIDLDAIKARLAGIPAFGAVQPAETDEVYCPLAGLRDGTNDWNTLVYVPANEDGEVPSVLSFIAHAPTDIAALIAELERLRSVLDGPPICACGSLFDEHHIAESDDGPACYLYTCQNADCGWQIGNNGEIAERLTLRTNPQTERLIARIFGITGR